MSKIQLCKAICFSLFLFSSALYAKSAVWQVSNDQHQLFIGGTVHLLPASEFPLPAEFDKAYQQADQLVFEIDLAKMADPNIAPMVLGYAMYQDGRTLPEVISSENFQRLQQAAAELGIDINALVGFKPDFILVQMMQLKLQQLDMAGEGVDMYFFNKGANDGKSTGYLETLEQQFELLFSISDGFEDEWLEQNLDQLDDTEHFLQATLTAWRRGDRDALTELTNEMHDTEVGQRFYQRLLTDRNKDWVEQIDAMLQTSEVEFVLVGALHLAGPDNVLDLLAERGYQVRQISAE
ncbi:TraB/GumN family protein [Alkalimonas collagenimarina]|uniref:TraB/GumN family protein n=1 Tax=Alkalimonas collagenimarina TaxID=400390 RepID=A0ABT9GXB0_9GAMM|nr:TraB/GumN family protein [Alkalimonas collagenimarina]MDP4535696.1 TraB/GumN family protein [Alkalimonas collagenimarina]